MTLAVQVNGKVRDHITLPVDAAEAEVKARATSARRLRNSWMVKSPSGDLRARRLVNIVV